MKEQKVNILGTEYTIKKVLKADNAKLLKNRDGYCDNTIKEIIVEDMQEDENTVKDLKGYERSVVRHEIIHAFLYESGLEYCSDWATKEEMVDYFAIQFEKMYKVFKEVKAL